MGYADSVIQNLRNGKRKSITYNSQPAIRVTDSGVTTSAYLNSAYRYTFDVTKLARAWYDGGSHGFVLDTRNTSTVHPPARDD